MEKISLIFFIIVTITIIIHLAECSSSGGGRSRSAGWSNYQARKRSFQPWHNRQTNPHRYPARQRSGDNSDYSDDSSSSGRRRLRPRPPYPYGQNGFPGRPPKIHNQPHDQHPFYQNNGKPNPRPNPQPNPFYQNNVHPNPDPHPFYENNPHPLPNSDPHPFYENNKQPKPRPDPNPFYQNNHQANPDPFHTNNHQPNPNPFHTNNRQPQPNPIYGTGIPPQSHPNPNPTVQDPFYQNNMNPQPQDPNPFYENNVQPQPRPNPILGLVPQPTGQPLPTDNPFVTDLDLDPIFGPDPQPQLPPNGQGLPTDPNPFYTNNVQPNLQPGPPINPTIARSDLPDISPGPVLQQPYVPGVPPTPQAALDPNDFYEQNNPKPVVPSIPKGPRVIRVTSPKFYVGETDPDAFYDNNIIPGPSDPVPTGTKPPNPPILIRDDPVINPVFDRPLYAAGVDPDAEVTILTAQETTTTPTTTTTTTTKTTTTTARPPPPSPPKEIPPKESPDVMAPIPDITPLVAVQTPKLHTDPLHVDPTGNENNIQLPDIEPPKGVKNPVQYEDPLVPDERIPKAIKNPIIHNDMDQQEPIPDEKIPTAIKNPIVHNDMDQRKPIPDKPIPKAITNPIIHNDMDPRDRTPDEFIPVAIQNPIVYDDINKKDKIPDVVPPPTVANPKMYDDYTERVEPGTWEITQCYTGALVCPNNCEASTYISGVRYCCPGCSGYKIHVENDVCKCLKRIDVFPSAFDDLNPDVINTQPDRGDVAYWTRGTGDDSASTNSNSGDVLEPLIGGTAKLVGNELPTDIVFNPPGGNPTVGQTPIKRDPVLDDQILSSVFGEIAAPPTTTPINQVKLDEFIQSVYSNGNPFDINSGK